MSVAQLETFQVSSRAMGIDLLRSQVKNSLGIYVADPAALFRAGMLVQLNDDQQIEICDGTIPFGFSKYNKTNVTYAAVVGEYIQLNGVIPTNLTRANLLNPASGGGVRVGATLNGTSYTESVDYTCNYVNGQITRIPSGTIPDGGYVYVNFQYYVTPDEMYYEGYNFWNAINDINLRNNKLVVINDWSIIFTTQYDSSQIYRVNDVLVAGNAANGLSGLVTKGSRGTAYIGRVFQVPTSSDPYLGIRYVGGMLS